MTFVLKVRYYRSLLGWLGLVTIVLFFACLPALSQSDSDSENFSIQVAPSSLFITVDPGQSKTVELKLRNNSTHQEDLKIELRDFDVNYQNNEVSLKDSVSDEVEGLVEISEPYPQVKAGEWYNLQITIKAPEDAGFSYWFALSISRQKETTTTTGQALKASVAVFTLVNINRQDATKKITLAEFKSQKGIYEYLPAQFEVVLTNGGNTILQPYGNIYIQRGTKDNEPLAVLPINESKGYILPNVTRSLVATWNNGFPVYEAVKAADNAEPELRLRWDWNNLKSLRFGKYTAKLVAVYNDGTRDVPLEAQLTFWVIPWKLLIIPLVILAILGLGIFTLVKKIIQLFKRSRKHDQTNISQP